jgi:hypothetical protein
MRTQVSDVRGQVSAAILAAQTFVADELLASGIESDTRHPTPDTRICSICDELKPAAGFRKVVGRTTTEACGECCDRRDSFEFRVSSFESQIEDFCLRLAVRRFHRFHRLARPLPQAVLTKTSRQRPAVSSCDGRAARLAVRRFLQEETKRRGAAPQLQPPATAGGSDKREKSALAKSSEEYAKALQRYPDRVAAIVAKTVAVKGDAFELDDAEALVRIMDLTNELDDTLIPRNAEKKLARSGTNTRSS